MDCIRVPLDLVDKIWPHVRAFVQAAIKRADLCPFEPIEQAVLEGRMLLWCATDDEIIAAAAVTDIVQTEWRKACVIIACGGHGLRLWLPLIAELEAYAKAENCNVMRIFGRKGWIRMLKDYRARSVVLEKDI